MTKLDGYSPFGMMEIFENTCYVFRNIQIFDIILNSRELKLLIYKISHNKKKIPEDSRTFIIDI